MEWGIFDKIQRIKKDNSMKDSKTVLIGPIRRGLLWYDVRAPSPRSLEAV